MRNKKQKEFVTIFNLELELDGIKEDRKISYYSLTTHSLFLRIKEYLILSITDQDIDCLSSKSEEINMLLNATLSPENGYYIIKQKIIFNKMLDSDKQFIDRNIDEFVIIKDVDWDSTVYLPKGKVGIEITIINLSEKPVMLSTISGDIFHQNDCPQIELPGNGFSLRFFYYDNNTWVNII